MEPFWFWIRPCFGHRVILVAAAAADKATQVFAGQTLYVAFHYWILRYRRKETAEMLTSFRLTTLFEYQH